MVKGRPNGAGRRWRPPPLHAEDQHGMVSGAPAPPAAGRRAGGDRQRRADQADEGQAGVPAKQCQHQRANGVQFDIQHQAKQRRDRHQRQSVVSRCAIAFAATASSAAWRHHQEIERAVLVSVANSGRARQARQQRPATGSGPMRASRLRSGPTANGTITTTIRKNSAPINAPPPTRTASRMSRSMRGTKPVMAAPS